LYGAEKNVQLGKYVINNRNVLKCGAGEGWKKSAGPIA
jgi:hypothetical protein